MKKRYIIPELEHIRFKLSNATLFDDLVVTSSETPNGGGSGMGELPEEPGIDLDGFGF